MSPHTADRTPDGTPPRKDTPAAGETGAKSAQTFGGVATEVGSPTRRRESSEPSATDVSTGLAHERTGMAIERNYLASERTLMGWIRTSISMITFGFTIGKLQQSLHDIEVKGVFQGSRTMSIQTLAYFLVIIGTGALFAATLQHILRVRSYKALGYGGRYGLAVWVAILLVLVGAFALTALVKKL